jgi:hypothetical protein
VTRGYDVAPDGRFVMIEPAAANRASLVLARNWDAALKHDRPPK